MKMKKVKKIFLMTICFLSICIFNRVYAGTTISILPSEPKVGETVTVTVTVADVMNSDVRVNVAGVVSGQIPVVNSSADGEKKTFSNTATFIANVAGTITASTTDDSNAVSNGEYVDVRANTSVNVVEKITTDENDNIKPSQPQENNQPNDEVKEEKKSNNANLSNLGITPNDFSGFKPGITSYNVTVENDVTSIQVYANVQDSKSKVSGTGTKSLNEGNNELNVVVTAEDGTTKTYTINVTRKTAEESDDDTEDEEKTEEENKLGLSELKIEGVELSPDFNSDIYEYSVKYIGKETNLDITTKPNNDSAKVEIVGNENLIDGENLINILVTDDTGENTVTYQITVNKSLVDEKALAKQKTEEQQKSNEKAIAIGIGAIIILVIIIVLLILKVRNKKISDEYSIRYSDFDEDNYDYEEINQDYEDDEEQEDEYNNQILEGPSNKKKAKGKRFK